MSEKQDQVQFEANLREYHHYLPLSNAVKYLRFWKNNASQIVNFIGRDAYKERLQQFDPMIRRAVETESTMLSNELNFERVLNHPEFEPDIFE